MKDYWSTDPTTCTQVFPRSCVETVLMPLASLVIYLTHNTQAVTSKFNLLMNISFTSSEQFSACKENSLDEGMTLWRGFLEFRTCNHGKIMKYGLIEWCVELNEDLYICNMET
jgi:hypothetical protein